MAKVENWKDLDEVLLGDGHLESSRVYIANSTYYSDINNNLDIVHIMSDELEENLIPRYGSSMDFCNWLQGRFGFHTWQKDTGIDEKGKFQGGDDYYWDLLYKKLNCVNQVIAVIDDQSSSNDIDKKGVTRVKGEAHFLRASYFFLLVNLYAKPYTVENSKTDLGVPMKFTEYVEDKEFVRSSVQEVYNQILADLDVAEKSLSNTVAPSVYHPNLAATYLLKSRVYLYMQDWSNAMKYAQLCIEKNPKLLDYKSLIPGDNVLSKTSPETIFTMGGYTAAYCACNPGSYYCPSFKVSEDMLKLYGNNDLRKNLYMGESQSSRIYPVLTKMNKVTTVFGSFSDVSDCFLLRSSEAYLNLAEAAACKGDNKAAKTALESLLKKRMETAVTINETGNELIQFIRDERAREFLCEGHRWFDLRRYAVCSVNPWSKEIVHRHYFYANNSVSRVDYYRLEKFDDAYTLPIPRTIYNFQNTLMQNERPERSPFKTDNY